MLFLPKIDIVKLDRSLILRLEHSVREATVVAGIIDVRYSLRSGGHRERIADGASEKAQLRPTARVLHWQTHAIEGIFPTPRPTERGTQ